MACLVQYCYEPPTALTMGPEGGLWVATGYQTCRSPCGGGTAIGLTFRPGGIGRYELPRVKLGLGPRAAPIRHGATSLLLVCGLPEGCRGQLRVVQPGWEHEKHVVRVLGRASYALLEGESRHISVPLFRTTLEAVREWPKVAGDYPYFAQVEAGPPGKVEARRGAIILAFPKRSG